MPRVNPPARNKPFVARWSQKKVARVAYLYAAGFTSSEIARQLNDGTSAASIRHQLRNWNVMPARGTRQHPVTIGIPSRRIRAARRIARARGLELADMLTQVVKVVLDEGDPCIDLLIGDSNG